MRLLTKTTSILLHHSQAHQSRHYVYLATCRVTPSTGHPSSSPRLSLSASSPSQSFPQVHHRVPNLQARSSSTGSDSKTPSRQNDKGHRESMPVRQTRTASKQGTLGKFLGQKPDADSGSSKKPAKRAKRTKQDEDGDVVLESDRPDLIASSPGAGKNDITTDPVFKPDPESSPDAEVDQEDGLSEEAAENLEEDKPQLAKKVHEQVQQTLKGSGKDPYPDWKPGEPVPYAALCTTFSLIEMTSKRLEILSHCSLFLRQILRLTPDDLLSAVQLMINKLAADYAGIELGIGESLIMKAIGESTGRSLAMIKTDQQEIGDLGLVAAKSRGNQPTMFKPKALTIKGVHQDLIAIAQTQGQKSQERKISGIKKLLSAADAHRTSKVDITHDKGGPSESKYIIRFLEGKLRLGLAEKTILVALAQAMVSHEMELQGKVATADQLAEGEQILKTVYSELPSYEVVIPAMLQHGIFELPKHCKLQPGVPLKPMLAKPAKAIGEVLDRFENKDFTCEYKYDGERAQIHYVSNDVADQFPALVLTSQKGGKGQKGQGAIFSRNSEDLSGKYPDILAKLETWVKPETKSFILDCETVAWDMEAKHVLPFQQLMTRKRKGVNASDIKVKVCVFAFDLLFHNGEPVVKHSFRERRQMLHDAFESIEGEFAFAQYGDTNDLEEIQRLLDESVKASCEGLMVKMLDTEESGYEPSKRTRNWLKVKKDYLSGLGDSLDLVVLGAYYGRGKRTSVYGAYLLAAYNSTTENYETICNIGTGFSEVLLEQLHSTLEPLVIEQPKPFYVHSSVPKDQPDVWFEPKLVWEVKAADLTLSPRYMAAKDEMSEGSKGISLRFPRYIQPRDDKKPEEATNTRQVAEMYRKQENVAKDNKGSVDDDFEY